MSRLLWGTGERKGWDGRRAFGLMDDAWMERRGEWNAKKMRGREEGEEVGDKRWFPLPSSSQKQPGIPHASSLLEKACAGKQMYCTVLFSTRRTHNYTVLFLTECALAALPEGEDGLRKWCCCCCCCCCCWRWCWRGALLTATFLSLSGEFRIAFLVTAAENGGFLGVAPPVAGREK